MCVRPKEKPKQTLPQNEESHRQVDKDPGEAEELHQVVHEQVAFLEPEVSFRPQR